ncbi:EamA family transporter [Promethearchaeum syntrophicum]|uniref:EamA family transporter n=1 Tax=Promethearchaeum syntrophicum TaxID=2594042 RepID=A0A5B9DCQ4_9ARCH|nr:DMT family transporter [Candidatus Prometheoarchaeum syntrophicum]QEE16667.1 4-amino-4-deoxy-L-arabinose-phosphoundecaprenol flippase subunit ArnE [Candidatus Prometheoarchaeum syntrophicum]
MGIIASSALTGRILLLGYERIAFKKAGKEKNSIISTFLLFFIATIILLPILFFYSWDSSVLLYAFPSAAIYTAAFLIYIYVLSNYEVSLIVPFYNFNVFFLLILSIIFLEETFNLLKVIGIFMLFLGTIFLNKESRLIDSLKAVYTNKGCQLMMLVSILMAIGRVMDTYLVESFNSGEYSIALYFLISFDIFIILLFTKKVKHIIPTLKSRPKEFLIGSATNAFTYLFLLISLTEMELTFAEPLSMLSVIISIIFSYIFFKEKIRERLIGGIIMSIGAILLIIQL